MSGCSLRELGNRLGTVVDVSLPSESRRRLAELGLRPGAAIRLAQRATGGGLVVDLDGSRIALDGATARAVTVDAP